MYFPCPGCGATLDDDARSLSIKCPHCGELSFSRLYQSGAAPSQRKVYSFGELPQRGATEPNRQETEDRGPLGWDHEERPPEAPRAKEGSQAGQQQGSQPLRYRYQAPGTQQQQGQAPWSQPPPGYPPYQGPYYRPPESSEFSTGRGVAFVIHSAIFLLCLTILVELLALGPAFVEVVTKSGDSPGATLISLLVPFPPWLVSIDRFILEQTGISIYLEGYAIPAFFVLMAASVLFSVTYLLKKEGEDLLCQLYTGLSGNRATQGSQLPVIGKYFTPKPSDPTPETRAPQPRETGREPWANHRSPWEQEPVQDPEEPMNYQKDVPGQPDQGTRDPADWEPGPNSFFSNKDNKFGSENNAFILVCKFFMMDIFILVLFNIITYVFLGDGVEEPEFLKEMRVWELVYGLLRASVYEELQARVLLLGLPLYFAHRFFSKEAFQRSGGDLKSYLFGRELEVDNWTLLFLLFSSAVFGLAHLPGWNIYKVIPTAIGGFLMGYLFVKKGLPAAILLHFLIDYLTVMIMFFDPHYLFTALLYISFLISILVGLLLTVYYAVRTVYWLRSYLKIQAKKWEERQSGS